MAESVARREHVTANGYGAFELVYDPARGLCEVTVRVTAEFRDAPASVWSRHASDEDARIDGDPAAVLACLWTEGARARFERAWTAEVARVWSGKYALKCARRGERVAVVCALAVVTRAPHFRAVIHARPAGERLRSRLSAQSHGDALAGFRATEVELCAEDVRPRSFRRALGEGATQQVPVVHEFGHMLGLDEQYAAEGRAPGAVNDSGQRVSACADDEDRVMDGGERVLPEHYETIAEALRRATGEGWSVVAD